MQLSQACKDLREVGFSYFASVKAFINVFKYDIEELKSITADCDLKPVSFHFHLDRTRENDIDDSANKLPYLL